MGHQPDFPPGVRWADSKTGYVLAAMIVEEVTGRAWHDEVEDRIIEPLGLRHTSWPGDSPTLPDPHARACQLFRPVSWSTRPR